MKSRIRRVVEGVHMGLGHDGLKKLIEKNGIAKVGELTEGDLVLCINRKGDKMKVIGCRGLVIGYLKSPNGNRLMKEAFQYLPQTFGGSGFDYDKAVARALESRFKHYPAHTKKQISPLEAAKQLSLPLS